jgi:hypothetical protein
MSDNDNDIVAELKALYSADEVAELDATMEAERDVYGSLAMPSVLRKEGSVAAAALQGLKDALAGLPQGRRQAYDEAVQSDLRVVEIESPPSDYCSLAITIAGSPRSASLITGINGKRYLLIAFAFPWIFLDKAHCHPRLWTV